MKSRTIYINFRGSEGVETVDEFPYNNKEERKYAQEMLREYNMAYRGGCYLSSRATKDWRENQ